MNISDDFKTSHDEFDWSPYPSAEKGKGWSTQMKQGIVVALTRGALSNEDIKIRYKDISDEEINEWVRRYKKFGTNGLMATKMERIREVPKPD